MEWDEISEFIDPDTYLTQNETSRWAYFLEQDTLTLTVNGDYTASYTANQDIELVTKLANQRKTPVKDIMALLETGSCQEILLNLINENFLYFDE